LRSQQFHNFSCELSCIRQQRWVWQGPFGRRRCVWSLVVRRYIYHSRGHIYCNFAQKLILTTSKDIGHFYQKYQNLKTLY
jgi:hypothetical protein